MLFFISVSAQKQRVEQDVAEIYRDSIQKLPAFTIFKDNYFITGTTLDETPSSENSDAKFQIGFKHRLTDYALFWDTFIFLTYQQVSFWNIYQESFPFEENNYNPGLGLGKLLFKADKLTGGLWFAFEHESNGLDGDASRSWNFFSLRYTTKIYRNIIFSIKGWVPVGSLSDNPDLLDYKSYFESQLTYIPFDNLIFEGEFRKSFTSDWRGKIQLSCSFRPFKNRNQFIYLQYFNGHAESLIDFERHTHMIRLGITLKDLNFLAR